MEFLREKLQNTLFSQVTFIGEIHDDNIVFLPKPVDTPDTLLHTLGIPRQVVVDQHGTELQVDAFGSRFSGYHEPSALMELIDQGFASVGCRDTCDEVSTFVSLQPFPVDRVGFSGVVGAVE